MKPRLRTHHKLFLSYAFLVAGVVLILIIGVDRTMRQPLLERAAVDLLRELTLGREIYDSAPFGDPDAIARRISAAVGHRVTIVRPDGLVIGESGIPATALPELDDHGGRPEVRDAIATGTGTAVRRSTSVDADLLYAAMSTERGDVLRFAVGIEQIDQAVARVRKRILQVGAVALLLAVVFSFGFSVAATRRLRLMRGVAQAMAGGDLNARVRPVQRDELGEMGEALDALAEQLQRRLGQLEGEREEMTALIDAMAEGVVAVGPDGAVRRANPAARTIFGLTADVRGATPETVARRRPFLELVRTALGGEPVAATELVHDGKHLLATAQPLPRGGAVLVFLDTSELRRLEGVRRDFVANASHELKTPLTAIRGYSETLLDDDLDDDLRRRFTRTIHDNAARLQQILDDLLDLSRIESGGWALAPTKVGVAETAREAWQPLADVAAGRGVALKLSIAEGAELVTADAGALRQVFSNLFSNALRYSPDGGTIEVRAEPSAAAESAAFRTVMDSAASLSAEVGAASRAVIDSAVSRDVEVGAVSHSVRVEVCDTGIGIPPEHVGRIFERFYRVDPARSREEGGTGLGLAIVRHLIERHGGRVEAESEFGHGTTIRFTMPAA
jgi:two-component system, OmpR family, phosphate regulon sensor histidine kinase PhoR